jgi:predicted aldo/keto reductase-like oxidoreductase
MIPTQPFGKTGHMSTRTLFGAASLSQVTQEEADQTLEVLLKYGVNHIDTAASYGDAELRIGPWMPKYRKSFFLATKTGQRTYQEAHDEIRKSLERLQVDQVDLIQLHNLVDPEEWEIAMSDNGALKAAIKAREEGLVRFIGVTGHGVTAPVMHLRALERFDFNSVLLPCNYMMFQNPQYKADFEQLAAVCQERQIAVQTIKSIARGPIGDKPKVHAVWYDPLTDEKAIEQAVHWVLSQPYIFLNTAGDIHLLPKVLEAAKNFQSAPPEEKMQANVQQFGMTPLFT